MPFIYQPLDVGAQEIRVLDIDCLAREFPLICKVRHISLVQRPAPTYEAISYCWGNPDPCSIILLDGVQFPVPRNTELALRHMTKGVRPRTLWIDAVCINQSDQAEREHQVALMREVYSQCARALIYLGEENNHLETAMQNIMTISREVRKTINSSASQGNQRPDDPLPAFEATRRLACSPFPCHVETEALISLYSRPWFRRVWVVQEALLAPEACVAYCGRDMPFQSFLLVAVEITECALQDYPLHTRLINALLHAVCISQIQRELRLSNVRAEGKQSGQVTVDLGFALALTSVFESSRSVDKLYGVLGLHKPTTGDENLLQLIGPDYSKDPGDVFRDAMRYSLAAEGLSLLDQCCHRDRSDLRNPNLPSWAWHADRMSTSGNEIGFLTSRHLHPLEARDQALILEVDDGNSLKLRGLEMSKISKVSEVLESFPMGNFAFSEWVERALALFVEVNSNPQHHARALMADFNNDGQRSQSTDWANLQKYVELCKAPANVAHTSAPKFPEQEHHDSKHAATNIRLDLYPPSACARVCSSRRAIVSASGYIGLGPRLAQAGDLVVRFDGGLLLYVLRKHQDHYLFIGCCYLDGAMGWQEEYDSLYEELKTVPKQVFCLR